MSLPKPIFRALMGLLLALIVPKAWPDITESSVIAVIVSQNGPNQSLGRDSLAGIFLRKSLLWPNRETIRPVNLAASHPLRRLFSLRVMGVEPEELENYWNDQYFQGIFPPYSVASEEAALRFVAESTSAIGYVSACAVDKRVKVLLFLTPTGQTSGGNPARHCPHQLR